MYLGHLCLNNTSRMKNHKIIISIIVLLLSAIVYILVVQLIGITLFIPSSNSMAPVIRGPSPWADIAIVRTRFARQKLQCGDIVWARINFRGQTTDVLRFVGACPGDPVPEGMPLHDNCRVPEGFFVLLSANSTGIDSKEFGLISSKDVLGKVVCVLPTASLCYR
jgi:hypothetical protein